MILTKANITELKKVTVRILCPRNGDGTGTVVHVGSAYYVLTAAHVIENEDQHTYWDLSRISVSMIRNSAPCVFIVEEVMLYDKKIDVAVMRVSYSGKEPLNGLDKLRILSCGVNGPGSFCGFHRGDLSPKIYSFENRSEKSWAIANVDLATQPLPPKSNFEGTSGGGIFYQDSEKNIYLAAFMSSLERYDGTNNEFVCLPAIYFNSSHLLDSVIDDRKHNYAHSDGDARGIEMGRCLLELDQSGYDKNQKGLFIENQKTDSILSLLRDDGEMTIVLTALSGMGKSKLIYEAFKRTERFDNRYYAKYDDNPKQILREAENILKSNYDSDGIIIVDDWPVDYISELISSRDDYNSQFRLIMVNHDYFNERLGKDSSDYTLIKLNPKEMEECVERYISQELGENDSNEADVTAIKHMSGGYPQMAIELVKAYKKQNKVGPEAVAHLMPKLLSLTPGEEKDEMAVLQTFSLCMPFPYKNASHEGFEFLIKDNHITELGDMDYLNRRSLAARLVQKYCPTLIDVQGIWLFVRPFPLAVWLTEEWFRKVCNSAIHFKELIDCIKEQPEFIQNAISEGFCKHIQQMSGNKEAFKMVDKLVNADVNNPFFDEESLCSGLGSKLLLAMSTVNPAAIASNLRRVLGNKDISWLREKFVGEGRRNVVWALERLCFAAESYHDGMEVLSLLAASENETISNNASGQMAQLFHYALAGTEVDLKERIKTLQGLIHRGDDYLPIVVRCFDAALRSGGFSRMGGAEKFGFENKRDYRPYSWKEVFEYWDRCGDLILEWVEEKPDVVELLSKMVERNVYQWARGGQERVLVPIMEKIAEVKGFCWDSGYDALAKTKYIYGIDIDALGGAGLMEKLKNNSFKTRLNEARYILNGKYNLGDKDQFELTKRLFPPLADYFIEHEVYNDAKEISALLDEKEYIPIDFIKHLVEVATEDQLKSLFGTISDLIKSKPQEYYSPFLGNLSSCTKGSTSLAEFLDGLRSSGRELLYVSLMAGTEGDDLDHFYKLIHEQESGMLHIDFLPIYLQYIRTYGEDRYLQLLKALRENYPDRPNELVAFVEAERFTMRKDEHPEAVAIIKDALLSFQINGSSERILYDYGRLLVETLQNWHDVAFAKQVNKKMIEVYNTQMVHLSTDGVFTELLKDYFEDVWTDFVSAFLGDDTFLFYYQVKDELGSGFGFGKGPLFDVDEELIKRLCIENPQTAPVRIASMAPCFDAPGEGEEIEQFSKWILWLLDNFGDQKDVRGSISGNLGSFSWTGNVSPYYERNIRCFEKLLNHKCLEVRIWAQQSIRDEKKLLEMEKNNEDFMRLRYEM